MKQILYDEADLEQFDPHVREALTRLSAQQERESTDNKQSLSPVTRPLDFRIIKTAEEQEALAQEQFEGVGFNQVRTRSDLGGY